MNQQVHAFIQQYKKLSDRELKQARMRLGLLPDMVEHPDEWAALTYVAESRIARPHMLKCLRTYRRDADKMAARLTDLLAYRTAHPHYCRDCDGEGYHRSGGSFDYKAGVGEPPSCEACESCFAQGYCPCCGEQAWDEEGEFETCPKCGWNDKQGPFAPPADLDGYFECQCPHAYNW